MAPSRTAIDWRRIGPWIGKLQDGLTRRFAELWSIVIAPSEDAGLDKKIAEQARAMAPVVWLLGKVQSGKSSIVRVLTGCPQAEAGSGFKACTRTARVFDFPPEAPIIRFLDTRGLGEVGYDPAEDLEAAAGQAQLMLVVIKALDHDQAAVMRAVRAMRETRPSCPILVAQTCLHEGYRSGDGHPLPYPYVGKAGAGPHLERVPEALVRSLAAQRRKFEDVPGHGPIAFVPIDFTDERDGFDPATYGLDALIDALQHTAPAGLMDSLREARKTAGDARARQAHPHIVGYAVAAAAADVVPLAGLVAVPGVQAKMLHSLALIYGVAWDRRTVGEFAAALGTGTALKALSSFGVRELVKLTPVYGATAGAAAAATASFAMTFALGKAACVFLSRRRAGSAEAGAIADAYRQALKEAFHLAAERASANKPAGP